MAPREVKYIHEYKPAEGNHSCIWRSDYCPNGELRASYYDGVHTVYDAFQHGMTISRDSPCLGYRPIDEKGIAGDYKWLTYSEVWERIQDFGSGLVKLDLVPEHYGLKCLGIFSRNRVEWSITEQACNAYGFTIVPTYETLGADAVLYIIRETGMKSIVCSSEETVKILSFVEKDIPLEVIIQMDPITEKDKEIAKQVNIKLYSMAEIEQLGRENRSAPIPPKPEDVCTICYTSGTTGNPKGALVTHGNLIASVSGCYDNLMIDNHAVYLSYLPLAHVLERLLNCAMMDNGARVGFYQGTTLTITDDIKALRPTVFTSVPRLLNKIYQKINEKIKTTGGLTKFMFDRGMEAKKRNLAKGYNSHWLYDRLVFNKIKDTLGLDRDLITISGSAPLSAPVLDFLRCLLGNEVVEGYGATETSGATLLQVPWDFTSGHVGGPMSCCEFRLEDVPDMAYLHTDTMHGDIPCQGRGELCLRGYNIASGYFRHPELNESAYDADGFFHTGDIAMVHMTGAIIDRKKNFFKLSQGEYVAAEKLEIIYGQSNFVSQIFVYGDSLRSFLVAIIVVEEGDIMHWAKENGISKSFDELYNSPELKKAIKDDFARIMKENGLKGFERLVDFKVEKQQWTVENGLLTPTFKLKRQYVQQAFQSDLDSLYAANPEH